MDWFISLFLFIGMVSISISPNIFKKTMPTGMRSGGYQTILVQNEEKEGKKGETDPHLILILKEIQKKLDEWLKKLNERIESEDITRFEIRFLEILRILREKLNEWLKSLNDRIESEDITRLEVRFLEILRNILEWFKEKIDAKLGPPSEQKTEMRYRTHLPSV